MRKYCPAGKIECELFEVEQNQTPPYDWICMCRTKEWVNIINSWNRCPHIPLQKSIEDKYEKAWRIYQDLMKYNREEVMSPHFSEFKEALKEAGL